MLCFCALLLSDVSVIEISSYSSDRKYSWQQTKTHSNPDLTRVGLSKEGRSGKSNSAEARIIKERNHIL